MRTWRYNWIILVAIVVHAIWGLVLLYSDKPLGTVPLAETPFRHNQYLAASIYLSAALLAGLPFLFRKQGGEDKLWGLLCCLPQQFLLMLSALTATRCVLRGSYADGVERPWEFIFCDQLWTILSMVGHTVALIDWYYWSRK